MESIRKRRNGYALLFATGICLMVWFGMMLMIEAAKEVMHLERYLLFVK